MVNVAIAGIGAFGSLMVKTLLESGQEVFLLTRASSSNDIVVELEKEGAKLVKVEYADGKSLDTALDGIDVVVSTLSRTAIDVSGDPQLQLAKASRRQGVRLFIPSMWGRDYDNEIVKDPSTIQPWVHAKIKFLESLQQIGQPWIAISNGLFSSLCFSELFGIDALNRKANLKVNPNQLANFTHTEDVAKFVSTLLKNPKEWPLSGGHWLYVESFQASFDQIVKEAERIDGVKWQISYSSAAAEHKTQKEASEKGYFAWVVAGVDDGRGYKAQSDNERLSFIASKTFEEAVKEALFDARHGK